MRTTRKKVIKTVYKDEISDEEEEGGDFSDSGSEAVISDASSSEDDAVDSESSSDEELNDSHSFKKLKLKCPPKKSTKPFVRRITKPKSGDNLKEDVYATIFSIKNLSKADKLLPASLNLSESGSSDDESPKTLKGNNFKSLKPTDQNNLSENEDTEYKNVWPNLNEAPNDSEEVARRTFMELEQHKSRIEETKAALQNYSLNVSGQESDIRDLLALGEEDIVIPEAISKKLVQKKFINDSDTDAEDWEEVEETKSILQQGIQLLVEVPDAVRRKTKKIDIEMIMKRKINRVKKENQIYMHKVHILCWLGHGNYINGILDDRELMAAVLSLALVDGRRPQIKVGLKYIEDILARYKDYVTLKLNKNEDKFKSKSPPLKALLLDSIKNKTVASKKYYVFIFVVLLRALGLKCRVMLNFRTLPIKPPASELCSLSTKDGNVNSPDKKAQALEKTISPIHSNILTKARTNKIKSKTKHISQLDGNYDDSFDIKIQEFYTDSDDNDYYENIEQVDGANDRRVNRRTRSMKRPISEVTGNIEDENILPKVHKKEFKPTLKTRSKCDEVKNTDLNKPLTRVKNAVDNKEIHDKSKNSICISNHFKELTNITMMDIKEDNLILPRKSPRRPDPIVHSKSKKDLNINTKSQRTRATSGSSDDFMTKNLQLQKCRKSLRLNPVDESDAPKAEKSNKYNSTKKTQCGNSSKLKGTSVITSGKVKDLSPSETLQNTSGLSNLKNDENLENRKNKITRRKSTRLSILKATNVNDQKAKSKSNNNQKHKKTDEFNEKCNVIEHSKSKQINDIINKILKNDTKANIVRLNVRSSGKKHNSASTTSTDNKLNVPGRTITKENTHTRSKSKVSNPIEVRRRLTRKTANLNCPENADRTVREKRTAKIYSDLSMEANGFDGDKKKMKKELTSINDTSIKSIGNSDNSGKMTKSVLRKRTVRGNVKDDLNKDDDYSPMIDKPKCQNSDSDSDDIFKPTKLKLKKKSYRRDDRRNSSLSAKKEPTNKNTVDVWCEIFDEELRQWVSVDVINGVLKSTTEIYANAAHPVCYVVGWDNNNYLKDLTRKYVQHYNTETRKLRVNPSWWDKALSPYLGPKTVRDMEEDQYLNKMQLEAPLPSIIGEYKNHPLYALKRHLLKFEAIYPPDASVLGFVRGEPVYARACIHTCRPRHVWFREHAKVVKLGEKPYKLVRARPRWDKINRKVINDDPPMEIFGRWQVEDYEPPMAENGLVPRNEYGNVELFKQCMLPKGTVHLKLPNLDKIAKKLNIDCPTAITGFGLVNGWVRPVYDGFVVCKEFEDIISEAWADDQEEQERKVQEKTEIRVYGYWKRFIKGLLIRERLKNKYGFDDSTTSTVSDKVPKSMGLKHSQKK